jgi:polyhydroxybutyrate depolymerase
VIEVRDNMWRYVKLTLAVVALSAGLLALAGYVLLNQDLPPRPELTGRLVSGQLDSGGRQRTWRAYVPGRRSARPALIVVLHGSMGSSATARIDDFGFDFDRIADREGAIVLYPQGFAGHWNNAARIGPYAAKAQQVDDVGFLHALVDYIASEYGADRTAVLVTGVSNGGAMVTRLALQSPAFARAYAVVSENLPTAANLAVVPSGEPVSTLFLNGTDDPIVPWRGGEVSLWPVLASRGDVRSMANTLAYFRNLAGVKSAPVTEDFPDLNPGDGCTASRTTWIGTLGHRIVQIAIRGGGHGAPHPEKRGMRLLGNSNRDIHAAEVIWEFFMSTSLTDAPRAVTAN